MAFFIWLLGARGFGSDPSAGGPVKESEKVPVTVANQQTATDEPPKASPETTVPAQDELGPRLRALSAAVNRSSNPDDWFEQLVSLHSKVLSRKQDPAILRGLLASFSDQGNSERFRSVLALVIGLLSHEGRRELAGNLGRLDGRLAETVAFSLGLRDIDSSADREALADLWLGATLFHASRLDISQDYRDLYLRRKYGKGLEGPWGSDGPPLPTGPFTRYMPGRIHEDDVAEVFLRYLESTATSNAIRLAAGLLQGGDKASAEVSKNLFLRSDLSPEDKISLVRIVSGAPPRFGNDEDLNWMYGQATQSSVRRAILERLSLHDAPNASSLALRELGTETDDVAASQLIGYLRPSDPGALVAIEYICRDSANETRKASVLRVIPRFLSDGTQRSKAIGLLGVLLRDSSRGIRLGAINRLDLCGRDEIEPLLREALATETDETVRSEIQQLLEVGK